jgi:hypothetical protein
VTDPEEFKVQRSKFNVNETVILFER